MHNKPKTTAIWALLILATGGHADEILRDPTRPYMPSEAIELSAPRFKVNAIIVSDERRIAIVNGKRVGVGGRVNGATIVSISKNELILDVDGLEVTLGLNSGSSRQ